MADKIFHSTAVTFVDMTDSRTLDVYISSNHPTVQLCDTNKTTSKYTPDWSVTNLELEASFYLDSQSITPTSIKWYTKIGTTKNELTSFKDKDTLLISTNPLSSNPIITYICEATYDTLPSVFKEITFTRVDTGLNGTNGLPAPAVQAQYSVDCSTWTSTLDAAVHKYIRYSYDGGKTYTAAIKMVGEDGTSVRIVGTATSVTQVSETNYYTLVYSSSAVTSAVLGDAYLYNGDLYVCADSRDGQDYFINVGKIQGPTGNDGQSSYLFIRYATDASGTNMSTSPSSTTTHIGICTVDTNVAPTTANSYTWSKFVGDSAKNIILSGDSQIFKVSESNAYTPSTIKVTAQTFNTSVSAWTYSTNGGQTFISTAPTGVTRNGNVITITGSSLTSNTLVVKASDGSIEDVFTIYKAFDGTDGNPGAPGTPASIAFLTNENVTLSANASGQITATSITTNVVAYNGTTKATPIIGTIANLPTGMTATIGDVVNNEIPIVLTITNNATLGSTSSNNGAITIPITSPVNTNLILTWSKVNAGPQGPQGNRGNDSYTVLLTNESHVFAGDVSNAVAGSTTTQVLAYNGTTAQTVTISSVNGKSAALTDTDTGIAGLTFKCSALSGTSPTITFTCTTEFVSTNGSIPIVLSVGGVSFTKMFTYSIAFKGSIGDTGSQGPQGEAGTSYWLVSSASAVQKTSTGTITVTPSTLTFAGKSQKGTNAPTDYAGRWIIDYSTDGTSYTNLYTSTVNEASKSITVATTYKTIRVRMYMTGGTTALLDEQIIPVVSDGAKGDTGRGVSKITEYYLATTASNGVTTSTSGWTTTIQTIDETKKYLWNYELITYTDNTTSTTTPLIIGVFGSTGKGIKSVTEYYLATTSSSGVTTSTTGWTTTMQTLTNTNKYLWNYELITYTDNTTSTINPVIIGVYGDKGSQGDAAYTVILTNESHVFAGDIANAITANATTQVLAYQGSTSQSVTIVSVNGKTASTSSTATGIAGLSFSCSALSGTSPTITFSCTTSFVSPSGTIPIVITVGGVTMTKMFTYSIAFKGSLGTPASLVDITPSAHYFKSTTGKDGTFTPDYIYLYPRFQTVTYSKWEYSTNGGTSWTTVTSGSNGLTIGTYNSVANSLQIAKTSALYTDSVTTISFRCVSSTASVYDTVSIAKIYDVVDLQIGGRNLYFDTKNYGGNSPNANIWNHGNAGILDDTYLDLNVVKITSQWGRRWQKIQLSKLRAGDVYTMSAWVKNPGGDDDGYPTKVAYYFDSTGATYTVLSSNFKNNMDVPAEWTRISVTFRIDTITDDTQYCTFRFEPYTSDYASHSTHMCVCGLKFEIGNKATDWSPAPEDLNNITFQIYAPKGYLLTNELQSLTLQTFAYEGSIGITSGATFKWSQLIDDVWTDISGATGTTLTVTHSDVLKAKSYRCVMSYKEQTYTDTVTVQDKTDTYSSMLCVSSNATTNECYWVLHSLVYSDKEEVDPLLGPILVNAPASPVKGDYWYSVDTVNATVTLKKYDGANWVNSTDKQSLIYAWNIIDDGSVKRPLGTTSKIKIVSCNDFTGTATLICEVSSTEDGLLTQASLSLTDASDPIVSADEPTATVDGQIWIKPNGNGTFLMFVWDKALNNWIMSDMDTRNKVYTNRPSSYNAGDLWITASDTDHGSYLHGTLLQAQKSNTSYNASDWSPTLRYDQDINDMKETLNNLSQYVTITSAGLRIGARSTTGELSPFTSLFTSTELSFYQNSEKLLTLANNQLTAPRIVVENDLEVQGSISLGELKIIIENNGSFSFAILK